MGPVEPVSLTIAGKSFMVPKLAKDGSNWITWKNQTLATLAANHGVMRHIEGTARTPPTIPIAPTGCQLTEEEETKMGNAEKQWDDYHQREVTVKAQVFMTIPEALLIEVQKLKMVKEVWDVICVEHEGKALTVKVDICRWMYEQKCNDKSQVQMHLESLLLMQEQCWHGHRTHRFGPSHSHPWLIAEIISPFNQRHQHVISTCQSHAWTQKSDWKSNWRVKKSIHWGLTAQVSWECPCGCWCTQQIMRKRKIQGWTYWCRVLEVQKERSYPKKTAALKNKEGRERWWNRQGEGLCKCHYGRQGFHIYYNIHGGHTCTRQQPTVQIRSQFLWLWYICAHVTHPKLVHLLPDHHTPANQGHRSYPVCGYWHQWTADINPEWDCYKEWAGAVLSRLSIHSHLSDEVWHHGLLHATQRL